MSRPQGRHRLEGPVQGPRIRRRRVPTLSLPELPSRGPRLRLRRSALLVAPAATVAVVGVGVATATSGFAPALVQDAGTNLSAARSHALSSSAVTGASRSAGISRDLTRVALATPRDMWSTADLNLYAEPDAAAAVHGELAADKKIGVTGRTHGAFSEVVVDRRARWVHTDYLAKHKPADPASMGLVFKPCPATASVEHGLVPGAIRAWEAVCNAFPQVSEYGGLANRPEHDTGHAVDAMVYGDTATGYKIAAFLQAHAAELDLYDIIYRQHIWTPVRASEGWRLMPDRGSPTANHMDHVHFAVN